MTDVKSLKLTCQICGFIANPVNKSDLGCVRGNTERFISESFQLWKCPQCSTLYSIDSVDFDDIYSDYALNKREIDIFARGTMANLLKRLQRAGLKKTDSILDYGCGNGVFVSFLGERGYQNVKGYDPFFSEFKDFPKAETLFDCVVNNDTLEHCEDIRGMIEECLTLLKPGGLLYIGTADSEPVEMDDLEPHIMRLHQPYHRIIITESTLHNLAREFGLEIIHKYRRSYHDTLRPFSNYRFLDELNKALGHNLDKALDPKETNRVFLKTPKLWFYAFFGYLFPSAYEPAVVLRKPTVNSTVQ